ncbi:hypothetical protein Leryth_019949 [Lithospermum erythrorhizon]|nr:hypothetical protein Leryth_019949 [Lithospermum erythrorhizon]
MQFMNSRFLLWIMFLIPFNYLPFSLCDPRISEAGLFCGTKRPPANFSYIPLFVKEMEGLSQRITNNKFGYYAENATEMSIYALAHCYEDLSQNDCLLCYAAARTRIPRCLPAISARLFLDGCLIRYDNYSFAHESIDQSKDTKNCSSETGPSVDNDEGAVFKKDAEGLIDNVTSSALGSGGGYAVRGSKGVYGLAQCWKTLSKSGCEDCLRKAGQDLKTCLPKREGKALYTGCYLRYSTSKFYNDPPRTNDDDSDAKKGMKVGIALGVAAFLMICAFATYAGCVRIKKSKQELKNLGRISNLYHKSNLNFKYENLEKATNYFDDSRKLGQGGAGSVFKGTLPNGNVVAVKRLFFNTRQWVDEFFNEVNLISGIQHKNLVKLLGCSIEGPESLLVYEFVPNKSLDQYLFDKEKVKILSWKERFNIIVGTAEGLAYLHGGSEIRIIHRDIKSSNLLLDENLNAKIADFGLARHFAADKTHLSTGIAGTLGYMAPEYIVKGQLTEKADVYSYGVLVLEIVCGRKNIAFQEDSGSLLQSVWKLYESNKLVEAVDPNLNDDFPPNEAAEVLTIALLCTQASVVSRPSMPQVLQMLTDKNRPIPSPNQPPFLNASMLATGSRPISIGNFVSNAISKPESSSYTTTTGSYSMQSSDGPQRSE